MLSLALMQSKICTVSKIKVAPFTRPEKEKNGLIK